MISRGDAADAEESVLPIVLSAVYASHEMMMPAYLPGTAPVATPDQIILVLGDFRGDVWLMDL